MDKALVGNSKIQDGEIEAGEDPGGLMTKRMLTDQEARELIQKYNGIYSPKISEKTRCGGTLKLIQRKLQEYYGF